MRISDRVQAMQNSPIRKFNPMADAAEAAGVKIYHLNIGQPDIETPSVFWEAVKGFDQKVLAYAGSWGLPELQDAIVDYFKRFDMNLERNDVLITAGGSEALTLTFLSIINPGDEVIVAEPYYTNYLTFIQAADGVVKPVTTYAEEGYKYAIKERLEAVVTDKTKMISIVNPGNPTGCILSREDMRVIADFAKEHDLWILADEVYREFAYDGREMTSVSWLTSKTELSSSTPFPRDSPLAALVSVAWFAKTKNSWHRYSRLLWVVCVFLHWTWLAQQQCTNCLLTSSIA